MSAANISTMLFLNMILSEDGSSKRTASSSKRIFQRSAKSDSYIRDPDQLHIGMTNVLFRDFYMIPVRMLGFP
ncbi:hypothetical protein RJ60_12460 [Mesotoga sp. B105.6.4]|nr:hypothetical protein RJ60_12460 [Mesotoga sp. B105.6.4]